MTPDPGTSLANWRADNTRRWRRAVASTWAGGQARINVFGPSTVAGYTTGGRSEWHAWPSYLRRLLARRYGESGTGVIYFHEADSRVAVHGSGWSREPYGPFGASCWSGHSTGQALTFGAVWCTGFRVTYLTAPTAGRFTAVSDIPGQIPTAADSDAPIGVARVALPAGQPGWHTLTVRPSGDGPVFILGVEGYHGPTSTWTPNGVSVTNVGRGSTVVANLTGADSWHGSSLGAAVDANPADLSVVAYAENSPGYQTPEQMQADYRVLLDRIRAAGSDLLLCTSIDWQGAPEMVAPQAEYDEAVRELVAEYDVPLFDIAHRWGAWEDSPGYYADRIHPSPTGYADIAAGLYRALHTGI